MLIEKNESPENLAGFKCRDDQTASFLLFSERVDRAPFDEQQVGPRVAVLRDEFAFLVLMLHSATCKRSARLPRTEVQFRQYWIVEIA